MSLCLVLNAGSSSVKFALFESAASPRERLRGQIEGLGANAIARAEAEGTAVDWPASDALAAHAGHRAALHHILELLDSRGERADVSAVGHRVVHGGMAFTGPVRVDDAVHSALETLVPLAPLHQPHNLAGIDAARENLPDAQQVACFDTAFHRAHPWVNDVYALPQRFHEEGVRRYGFHGLSYEYVSAELAHQAPVRSRGRVVIAHLGNGASMCALRALQSVGSSMGFSALEGLPMGTRCGQLDPGVVLHLLTEFHMSPAEVEDLLYRESGLRGLSGISHDVRVLEASDDPAAGRALDYFVFWARRELGGLAAILGGLDILTFCGGIGENSARIRAGICENLEWLGLRLDHEANRNGQSVISAPESSVEVRIIPTDEEQMIAHHTFSLAN